MKIKVVEKFTNILREDIEAVKKNYPKIEDEMFYKLIALDPTYKENRDSVGKYGKWILNLYNKGNLKEEDFYKVTNYLNEFEEKRKGFKNKDIGQFKTLPDLAKALDEVEVELSHSQQVRQNQKARKNVDLGNEASLVFDGDGYEIWVPHTYAASCKLGQGTHWCTASTESDRYYNSYLDTYGGEYYILIDKSNGKPKYQFHFESNQFMDEYDDSIDIIPFLLEHESIKKFFEPKVKEMLHLTPNTDLDNDIEVKLDSKLMLDTTYENEVYDRDHIYGNQILDIINGDVWEWFIDVGDYYSFNYFTNYPPELNEYNKETLTKLGYDVEDYPQCLEDTPAESAYVSACRDTLANTAEQECYNDTIKWLEDNDITLSYDNNGYVVLTTTCSPWKVLKEFYDYADDTYMGEEDGLKEMVSIVKGIELAQNPLYEPRYGWQGDYSDESVFNDIFSNKLSEIEPDED